MTRGIRAHSMVRSGLCWLAVLLLFGCGGGGGSRTTITVTITPAVAVVPVGTAFQFTVFVSGSNNQEVTWAVNDVAGGNAQLGTISSTGLYTAPTTVPSPPTVTIKATSAANPNSTDTATVTIDSGVQVTLNRTFAVVGTSETLQMTATVSGSTNQSVTWSVNDVAGGNSSVGTISADGLYTSPAALPSPALVTIKAAAVADPSRSASASITLRAAAAPVLNSVNPTRVAQGALFADIHLAGSEFRTTTIVRVNGAPVSADFLELELMRLRLTPEMLQTPATLTIDLQQQSGATSGARTVTIVPVRPALVGPSPDSAPQGSATVSVNFTGGYYTPSVAAEFNGQPRAATLSSSRQLNVAISDADLATAGLFSVAVRNAAAPQPLAATNLAVQPNAPPASLGTVAVGTRPFSVAVNTATGVAVVVNRGSNSLSLIDLATQAVSAPITVGDDPTGVAVDNERNLAVVANRGSNNLSVVNLATGAVTATIGGVGTAPFAVAVNPLTGLGLVAVQSGTTASIFDLATNTVLGTVALTTGENPQVAVATGLDWAVVTPGGSGSVSLVHLGSRQLIASLQVGSGMRGLSINSETERALMVDPSNVNAVVFSLLDQTVRAVQLEAGHVATAVNPLTDVGVIVNPETDLVSVMDLRTPARLATIAAGVDPRAAAIDPGSNVAVVANEGSNTVSLISLGPIRTPHLTQISPATILTSGTDGTLRVTGFGFASGSVVRLDGAALTTTFVSARRLTATVPAAMLAGPRRFAVEVENPGGQRTNVAGFAVLQAVPVGTAPQGVAIDPERDLAVVANSGSNNVSLVNLNTGAVTATIPVGTNPQGVAVVSRLGRAAVTNRGSNTVSLVDLDAATVAGTAAVGLEPIGVAANPNTGGVITTSFGSGLVHIFNVMNPVNIEQLIVDENPVAVAFDPTRNRALVASAAQNSVQLVDVAASSIVARATGLQLATGLAYDPVSDRYLVLSSLANNLHIVNPANLTSVPVRVGINPTSVAYNFHSSTLVTVNTASRTVSVMDFLERRVRAILSLSGSTRFAVAIHPRTNLCVLVDADNNRVLLVPLPR